MELGIFPRLVVAFIATRMGRLGDHLSSRKIGTIHRVRTMLTIWPNTSTSSPFGSTADVRPTEVCFSTGWSRSQPTPTRWPTSRSCGTQRPRRQRQRHRQGNGQHLEASLSPIRPDPGDPL